MTRRAMQRLTKTRKSSGKRKPQTELRTFSRKRCPGTPLPRLAFSICPIYISFPDWSQAQALFCVGQNKLGFGDHLWEGTNNKKRETEIS